MSGNITPVWLMNDMEIEYKDGVGEEQMRKVKD